MTKQESCEEEEGVDFEHVLSDPANSWASAWLL
jgi:hypothetical protein